MTMKMKKMMMKGGGDDVDLKGGDDVIGLGTTHLSMRNSLDSL